MEMIVGIAYNHLKPNAKQYCNEIASWLKGKRIKVKNISYDIVRNPKVDFIISLGGDGTILRISRLVAKYSIPVMGVNPKFINMCSLH